MKEEQDTKGNAESRTNRFHSIEHLKKTKRTRKWLYSSTGEKRKREIWNSVHMNLTRVGPMMRSNPIEEDGLAKAFDTDEHRIRDFARGYSCRENIVSFAFPSILDPPRLIFQCSVIYHHEIGAIDISRIARNSPQLFKCLSSKRTWCQTNRRKISIRPKMKPITSTYSAERVRKCTKTLTLSRRCELPVAHGIHSQCRPTVSLSDLCRFECYLSEIWHTDRSWITQLFHANRASIHYVMREVRS